ncbi:LppC family lipoprotein [mine drainage metagenome]|uniref:LppC family lipoprotein n=2 Tax=mine drainage metagenome TaxID=410659 RepID=T1C5B8_9ZZZZ
MRTLRLTLGALISLTLLASCATLRPPPSAAVARIRKQARTAEQLHEWSEAARLHTQLAAITRRPKRAARALVRAAEDWIQAGQPNEARRLFASPLSRELGAPARVQAVARMGATLLQNKHPGRFLALVHTLPPVTGSLAAPLLRLEADAWFARDRADPAIRLLDERARLLTRTRARTQNARLLWSGLIRLATAGRRPLPIPAEAGETERAWITLANLMRSAWENPADFRRGLLVWKRQFPDHTAEATIIAHLVRELNRLGQYPKTLAVLLPLTGSYGPAGLAIERGLLASRYSEGSFDTPPVIRFYNTGSHVKGALDAYRRALRTHARWIVGPLLKPQVRALLARRPAVGVLALNDVGRSIPKPDRFYEFGLSPRDELHEIVDRLIRQHRLYGGALIPHGSWGRAILKDLKRDLDRGHGKLIAIQRYTPNRRSYSSDLEHFLRIRGSIIRGQALAGTLGMRLTFTPAPRSDLDFILLIANTLGAREIMPELRYFGVTSVPVYGLSRDDVPGTIHEDLDGLRVPETPWSLGTHGSWMRVRTDLATLWPQSNPRASRFMAFGFDAYRLIPWLRNRPNPGQRLFWGATGFLSLGKNGRIDRHFIWVRFESGRAVPVDSARMKD